jgi:diguanylate cyclase (GGDEF)-like protein
MIADDSNLIRTVVRAGLEAEGYQVIQAEDGSSALEICRECRPDVVLLDVIMPGPDGYEVLAAMKNDPELAPIPVVFLTSRTGMADVVAGLRAGAHDYLRKPFEPEELLARVGSAVKVKKLQDQLRAQNAILDQVSRTDSLTGLFNRRHLDEQLALRHGDARRHRDSFALMLFDLDNFKNVNDTCGHAFGDAVLREFAARLANELRIGDIAGRWGGEEFLVILPRTDLSGAIEVAERVRTMTASRPIQTNGGSVHLTVSGGCAAGIGISTEVLLHEADARMYEAKAAGRNKIVAAELPS